MVEHLGYIAQVNLGFDLRRNRKEALGWCQQIYSRFPELIAIPNLRYEDFDGENQSLFYYSANREDVEDLKGELDNSGLVKEVILGALKENALANSKK